MNLEERIKHINKVINRIEDYNEYLHNDIGNLQETLVANNEEINDLYEELRLLTEELEERNLKKKLVSNKEILDEQIDNSGELVDFQATYVPSPEDQMEINELMGNMDIFNIRETLTKDKSKYTPLELLEGNNSLIRARNSVIEATNQLIIDYPNATIVEVEDGKYIMFRDMIEETINNVNEEACDKILANIEKTKEHEAKLKRENEKMTYFTIKYNLFPRTFIIFEYMPLPPSQMVHNQIPLPGFRFITLATENEDRPEIDDKDVDEYVSKFYYEFEKLHQIDEAKIDVKIEGEIVDKGDEADE